MTNCAEYATMAALNGKQNQKGKEMRLERPVLRNTVGKKTGPGMDGQLAAYKRAGRIATLRMINEKTQSCPGETFDGVAMDQIDEVRDYLVQEWNAYCEKNKNLAEEKDDDDPIASKWAALKRGESVAVSGTQLDMIEARYADDPDILRLATVKLCLRGFDARLKPAYKAPEAVPMANPNGKQVRNAQGQGVSCLSFPCPATTRGTENGAERASFTAE